MKYKIIQTCDATSDYIKLFNLSSLVNKEYCKKWNYDYDSFICLTDSCPILHVGNSVLVMED